MKRKELEPNARRSKRTKTTPKARDVTLWRREPRRKNILKAVLTWTDDSYLDMSRRLSQVRRGDVMRRREKEFFNSNNSNSNNNINLKNIWTLDHALFEYMSKYAIRVPQIPRTLANKMNARSLVLYRGIFLRHKDYNDILEEGYLYDNNVMTFTPYIGLALNFTRNRLGFGRGMGVLLVLRARDIPRNTPWIWMGFGQHGTRIIPQSNILPTLTVNEDQVILPPGQLEVLGKISVDPEEGVAVVNVEYDDDYIIRSLWKKRRV